MCDCKSISKQTGIIGNVILHNPYTGCEISIDSCIGQDILMLWRNSIQTFGSCCGHNEARPSIVVFLKDRRLTKELLPHYDVTA